MSTFLWKIRTSILYLIVVKSYQLFRRTHEDHMNQHHISPLQRYMTPEIRHCYKCPIHAFIHKEKYINNMKSYSLQATSHVLSIQDNLLQQSSQLLCHWLLYVALQNWIIFTHQQNPLEQGIYRSICTRR